VHASHGSIFAQRNNRAAGRLLMKPCRMVAGRAEPPLLFEAAIGFGASAGAT